MIELEIIKKNQTISGTEEVNELNYNAIERLNNRINQPKERICDYNIGTLRLPSKRGTKKKNEKR